MKLNNLAKQIYEVSHLVGEFKLRSGLVSNEYFDKYLFESDPNILNEIAINMKELIPEGTDLIAGLEMGGIPIATAVSLNSGIRCMFVRKQAKEYGTCKIAEGTEYKGKKVCIIEDVVTTGGQIIKSVKELRERGALVDRVLCVILRDSKAINILKNEGLELSYVFTMDDLKGAI